MPEDDRPVLGIAVWPEDENKILAPDYVRVALYFGTLGAVNKETHRPTLEYFKDKCPNRWADLVGSWDVMQFRHRTELWWDHLASTAVPMDAEVDNGVVWWGFYYGTHWNSPDAVWVHAEEVT